MKTREKILDLAIELTQKHGDLGWSYEDISEKIGIRKASIHYHFPKKEQLILEATRLYIIRATKKIEESLIEKKNVKEKLISFSDCYRSVFCQKDKLCLCIAISQNYSAKDSALLKLVEDFFQHIHHLLYVLLSEGQTSEEVNKKIKPKNMATMILALFQGLLILGENGWKEKDFEETLEQLLNII
ncbi:MAG: hypothetical protein CMO81_02425 [Waddliaceae bacterium]|nr:hypothetical protein [Waddliaceae bacterium]